MSALCLRNRYLQSRRPSSLTSASVALEPAGPRIRALVSNVSTGTTSRALCGRSHRRRRRCRLGFLFLFLLLAARAIRWRQGAGEGAAAAAPDSLLAGELRPRLRARDGQLQQQRLHRRWQTDPPGVLEAAHGGQPQQRMGSRSAAQEHEEPLEAGLGSEHAARQPEARRHPHPRPRPPPLARPRPRQKGSRKRARDERSCVGQGHHGAWRQHPHRMGSRLGAQEPAVRRRRSRASAASATRAGPATLATSATSARSARCSWAGRRPREPRPRRS